LRYLEVSEFESFLKIGHKLASEVERILKALLDSLDNKPLKPRNLETSKPLPSETRHISAEFVLFAKGEKSVDITIFPNVG